MTKRTARAHGLAVAIALLGLFVLAANAVPAFGLSTAAASVSGTIQGPNVLATHATGKYVINATGGPAVAANGTRVGNLTFYASVSGPHLTGVSLAPETGSITTVGPGNTFLSVSGATETLTIRVMISSTSGTENQSVNLTYTVNVVTPYVVSATLVNSGSATVLGVSVAIALDGTVVGNVSLPAITPGGEYNLSYQYATVGLSPGDHTFSLTIGNPHGLVTFTNGATTYTTTFYVAGPAPDNTVWYVLGVVAFFGVLFIFMTRVAARRRGVARK